MSYLNTLVKLGEITLFDGLKVLRTFRINKVTNAEGQEISTQNLNEELIEKFIKWVFHIAEGACIPCDMVFVCHETRFEVSIEKANFQLDSIEAHTIGDYVFHLTCRACPEQYDVYTKDGVRVAYVRLRYYTLTCNVPFVAGEEILNVKTYHNYGDFITQKDRDYFLGFVAQMLDRYYSSRF